MPTRRQILRSGLMGAGLLGLPPAFWRTARAVGADSLKAGSGPYGPLQSADANGIMLPKGFTSRIVAQGRTRVAGTLYRWHDYSDGAASFATPDGGWILACNSEADARAGGGASAIRFDRGGEIVNAYRILTANRNCAGGKTPWGTWMSCEEFADGRVWECDPTGSDGPVARPAMGVFKHEAVAVDPTRQHIYLTEDELDGGLYRFTPTSYPDCSRGRLAVAVVGASGRVRWVTVPDPRGGADNPTRKQVAAMTRFERGEGIAFDAGLLYVATTADSKIHAYDTKSRRLSVLYDRAAVERAPLRSPDNVTVAPSGDIFVGEDDGGEDPLDLGLITPEGVVARFLKLTGTIHVRGSKPSEVTGPTFNPDGTRLYFSSQRARGFGIVYEISGPFRTARRRGAPSRSPRTRTKAGPGAALAVEVTRSRTRKRLLRQGLPIALTLDRAAKVTVVTSLRVPGRSRPLVLGRSSKRLGPGPTQLRVKLSRAGRRRLRAARRPIRLSTEVRVGKRSVRRATRVR